MYISMFAKSFKNVFVILRFTNIKKSEINS